jgi:integrase
MAAISPVDRLGASRTPTRSSAPSNGADLDQADREGLEHPFILLAIRLQFAFAARKSEILGLRWERIDFGRRRGAWPDSQGDGIRLLQVPQAVMRSRIWSPGSRRGGTIRW